MCPARCRGVGRGRPMPEGQASGLGPRERTSSTCCEGVAQLADPGLLVLGHQPDAPGQCLAPAAGHAGVDQRVEHVALGHPQPGHDRDARRGEDLEGVAAPGAPGDRPAELLLGLRRDADALLAGVLTVTVDPGRLGGGAVLGRGAGRAARPPARPPDDQDLVGVDGDLGRLDVPVGRHPADHPGGDALALLAGRALLGRPTAPHPAGPGAPGTRASPAPAAAAPAPAAPGHILRRILLDRS